MAKTQQKNSPGTSKPLKKGAKKNAPLSKTPPSRSTTVGTGRTNKPGSARSSVSSSNHPIRPAYRSSAKNSPLALTFRDIEPSWRAYIAYVDYAANEGDEDMRKIMDVFCKLTNKEKTVVMPERLCDLAGVKASDLVGAVCGQVWAHKAGESAIAAAINHPNVVRKTAKASNNLKYGGRDRELFFRVSGSLPDKKGTTIINNNNPQTALVSGSAADIKRLPTMEEAAIDMDHLLTS